MRVGFVKKGDKEYFNVCLVLCVLKMRWRGLDMVVDGDVMVHTGLGIVRWGRWMTRLKCEMR